MIDKITYMLKKCSLKLDNKKKAAWAIQSSACTIVHPLHQQLIGSETVPWSTSIITMCTSLCASATKRHHSGTDETTPMSQAEYLAHCKGRWPWGQSDHRWVRRLCGIQLYGGGQRRAHIWIHLYIRWVHVRMERGMYHNQGNVIKQLMMTKERTHN